MERCNTCNERSPRFELADTDGEQTTKAFCSFGCLLAFSEQQSAETPLRESCHCEGCAACHNGLRRIRTTPDYCGRPSYRGSVCGFCIGCHQEVEASVGRRMREENSNAC